MALIVPISFAALGFVFWKRSIVYGLVLLNAVVVAKLVWSFYFGDASGGLTLLPSALAGLAVCDAAILYVVHRIRKGSSKGSSPKPPRQVSQHGG
jgi:hypothetical protein